MATAALATRVLTLKQQFPGFITVSQGSDEAGTAEEEPVKVEDGANMYGVGCPDLRLELLT